MQNLKLIQDMNNDLQLTILNIINMRWLSISNIVHNLHQIIFSVIDALNDDMNNAENPRDKIRASQMVNNLDSNFIISTMFLADLITILRQYMKNNNTLSDHLPSFISKFAKAIVKTLQNRFPDSEIYNALRIFDPKFLPQRESSGENFPAYFNETDLKQEWEIIKQIMKSICNFDFVKEWEHIWNTKLHFTDDYPILSKLVRLALIISLSNAYIERVFLHHKLTKTKL
ncbi:ribonuclease H-like domain-containing protein [Rhizophagus clarus]|uniref:Ribonuclease H-like domain-containing protein n=1 Tax=Rhizophagus clarus TaxID=94130 RepID=A0A8H3R7P4_9GLOM|nr:ribonuclease H-like domain-containing protein [Rhizophagus clarus]